MKMARVESGAGTVPDSILAIHGEIAVRVAKSLKRCRSRVAITATCSYHLPLTTYHLPPTTYHLSISLTHAPTNSTASRSTTVVPSGGIWVDGRRDFMRATIELSSGCPAVMNRVAPG